MFNLKRVANTIVLLSTIALLAAGCSWQQGKNIQPQPLDSQQQQELQPLTVVYGGVDGRSALDLLKEKYPGVETKQFSFGEMVNAIAGVKAEEGKNFWSFYVNGQQAQVGASQYVTKNGEKIEWKLENVSN
jgi:hypothetical protein